MAGPGTPVFQKWGASVIRGGLAGRRPRMTSHATPAPPISSAVLAAYAAPNLAFAALYFPVFVFLAPFYAQDRGVPLEIVSAILIGARLLDAVTDPAMGALSDRWETRFGRRKIWLAVSIPLVCLSVWMAMAPDESVQGAEAWPYVALWMTALTLSWTVALTPYFAWGGEIATTYADRARTTAWRESAFLIGTAGAAVAYQLGGGGGEGLALIALLVVAATPVLAGIALLGAPEPKNRSRRRVGWAEGAAALRANAPFRRLLLAYLANGAANALPAALFLFFASHVLGADDATAGGLLLLYFLCAVAAAPFWAFAARRLSKHRAWGWAMVYACLVFAAVPFLGEGDIAAFAVICVLTGVAFGADIVLPPAIQADVVDVDTAMSGEQRTGLYFAIWSVATKAATGVAGGAALWALASAGFEAGALNGPDVLLALSLLYAGAPVILKLIAVALIWRFPLDAAAQEALRQRIEAEAGAAAPR